MTKRRLRFYVKPTLFIISLVTIFLCTLSLIKNLKPTNDFKEDYVVNPIIDNVVPVVNTDTTNSEITIIRPYKSESVKIAKSFYDKDSSEEEQKNSLIYYENTYLPNSGVIYTNLEEFDVVSVIDGTVIDIKEDDILGKIVYVSHSNNLTTIYHGLKDVNLKINDMLKQNDVIGKSTKNKFDNGEYTFLFEVNHNGKTINPEKFYTMSLEELN